MLYSVNVYGWMVYVAISYIKQRQPSARSYKLTDIAHGIIVLSLRCLNADFIVTYFAHANPVKDKNVKPECFSLTSETE